MLLQGNHQDRRPAEPAREDPAPTVVVVEETGERGGEKTGEKAVKRNYPPIVISPPPLGQAIADGLSGMSRATLTVGAVGAVIIGVAMVVAIIIGAIVMGLGFNPGGAY
ncbi:hypothetical protein AB0J83_05795 [Actinoplanes sp. NPDC049596]|uniref:hypothetical protein n=1 Tax=unclassified Actinoplanes TaxID=2626549 RepID=UPI00343D4791